jgi:hypothetical protein
MTNINDKVIFLQLAEIFSNENDLYDSKIVFTRPENFMQLIF